MYEDYFMRLFYKEEDGNKVKLTILGFIKLRYKKSKTHSKKQILPKEFIDNRYIYDGQAASDVILETLTANKPCLIARYGTTELSIVEYFEKFRGRNNCSFTTTLKNNIADLSGFFPTTDNLLSRFSCEFIKVIQNVDVLGVRFKLYDAGYFEQEEYFIEKYSKNAELIHLHQITPYNVEQPWMQYLKGKKVLVIHPFEDTIKTQYQKREKLFKNADLFLPEFELKTIKAVQSLADAKSDLSFETWFDALKHMYNQIDNVDFDIALIGAGAYGIFLGDYIKRKGKQAVHVGGALQLCFGIRGKRWDSSDTISKLYNEHWVIASENEKPKGLDKVEEGCYW